MEPSLQVKLLRALQEREIVRVGGQQAIPVDVRLVAATHQNLEQLIAQGRFREDLFYRLKGVEVEIPPLRERRADIPHLIRHFTEAFCTAERIATPQFGPDALALLMSYDYPGNVRELQNLVEGAVSLAEGSIDLELVQSLISAPSSASSPQALDLASAEKSHIARVLRMAGGNKTRAARLLGVDRRTLQRKGF